MKKITFPLLTIFAMSIFLFSCSKQENATVVDDGISDEIKQMVYNAGFHTDNIVKEGDVYLVEGDIRLTKDELAAMASPNYSNNLIVANTEHYRTTNLVSGTRTITVSLNTSQANFNKCY